MTPVGETVTALSELGETLGALRLCPDDAVRRMQASLAHHGQLTAIAAYPAGGERVEVIDGFKRVRAARELGWVELRTRLLSVDRVQAKASALVLNAGRGFCDLEEAWLVRSLYREDGLGQPDIGRLLGRHKSWVCRRLALVEGLDDAVQADVRLGLLAPSAALGLCRLPRRNQRAAADIVIRRGLTTHQTERLVAEALEHEPTSREAFLRDAASRVATSPPDRAPAGAGRSVLGALMGDVAALTRISARIQARLIGEPLAVHGEAGAALATEGLEAALPVLAALMRTVAFVLGKDRGDGVLAHS